jgi:hypothetical protein
VAVRPWEIDAAASSGKRINVSPKPTAPSVNPYIQKPNGGGGGSGGGSGGGGGGGGNTSPTTYNPTPYPRIAPALSSAQLGALGERRRVAEEAYQQTLAGIGRNEALYRTEAQRKRENQRTLSDRQVTESMRELGGRGTARSPMVSGRMVRAADQDLQMKWGEIDSNLGIELSALKSMVEQAESAKATELALIEQERANMRANLNALYPASSMYGSN